MRAFADGSRRGMERIKQDLAIAGVLAWQKGVLSEYYRDIPETIS